MRVQNLLIAGIVAALVPASAFAMRTQTFEFASGKINASWAGMGPLEIQKVEDGILLSTGNGTGFFLTTTAFFPEGGTVVGTTKNGLRLSFAWTLENEMLRQAFDVPLVIPKGTRRTGSFSMREAEDWKGADRKMGLMLPPNSSILLHRIELTEWNMFEQWIAAEKSFWVFDEYRPYSINFLWGPQIGWNPVERTQLYDFLPPIYTSGTLLSYQELLAAMIIIGIWAYARIPKSERKEKFLRIAGALLLLFWVIFDVRMGGEFLSWVIRDQKTYIGANIETRTFRDRDRFYDFAEFAAEKIKDRESYIFFAEQPWPYLGNMRYITYPAIPGIDIEHDDTWAIYHRPDISVGADGKLVNEGQAISAPGTIIGRFDASSFIFRTNVPPAPAQ